MSTSTGGGAPRRGGANSGAPGASLPRNMKPTRDMVLDAMEQGLTTPARIAHKWGRSAQAARGWISGYGLATPELVQKALQERADRRSKEAAELLLEPVEGELVDEETVLPSDLVVPSSLGQPNKTTPTPTPLAPAKPLHVVVEPDLSAFDKLTSRQQKAALVLASFSSNLTSAEVARKADVSPETIAEWRRDATFQEAVTDLMEPSFRFEAKLMLWQSLLELTATKKARPEDRRLLAELAGMIGQQGSVSVNFTRVEGWKRWGE